MKKNVLISSIAMMLVMVIALSTATYAWFTASGVVTTDTIEFTAQTTQSLEVSLDNVNYSTNVSMVWNQPVGGVWPVTLEVVDEPASFSWTESNTGVGVIVASEQVFMEELYLRSSSAMTVSLNFDSFIQANAVPSMNGTIDRNLIVGAVRIAIFDTNNNLLLVWAPNANIKLVDDGDIVITDDITNVNSAPVTQTYTVLSNIGSTLGTSVSDNQVLISLTEGLSQKITVVAWIEGTDNECHNVLSGGLFDVSLSFAGSL